MQSGDMVEGQWYNVGIGADAPPAKAAWQQRDGQFHAWAKFTLPGASAPIMVHASTDIAAVERGLLALQGAQSGGRFFKRLKRFGKKIKRAAKRVGLTKVIKGVVKVARKALNNPLVQAALRSNPFGQAFLVAQKGAKMIRAARRGSRRARRKIAALRARYRAGDPRAAQAVRYIRTGLKAQGRMGPLTRAALSGSTAQAAEALWNISGCLEVPQEAYAGDFEIMGDDEGVGYLVGANDPEGQELEALWSASGDLPFAPARSALETLDADIGAGRPWRQRVRRSIRRAMSPRVRLASEEGQDMEEEMSLPQVRAEVIAGADPLSFVEFGRGRWRRRLRKRLRKVARHAFDPRKHLKHIRKLSKMAALSGFHQGEGGAASGYYDIAGDDENVGYLVGIGMDTDGEWVGYGWDAADLGPIMALPQVQAEVNAGADPLSFVEFGRGRWRKRFRRRLKKFARHAFDPRKHFKHLKRGLKFARKASKFVPMMGADDSARSTLDLGRNVQAARMLA